ncbi:phage tail tape measure protein [Neptuniibacter marinus]|uniref:phage tail tape measure protein n=1 Tax=Neptuniibacter marinus TaxID=1806670 RepID=UPI00082A41C5|nr:phage tail tape measure protein [Neptuniibacter marinus]
MTDLTTSLILELKNSQFTRGLRKSGSDVGSFANKSERELRGLRQEFKQLTGGVLGSFRNEIIAIGAAWSGLQIAKDSALLDKNLTRMSQTAGVARSETKALRAELFDLQKQYGVTVDSSRQANDSLLQSGLNWSEALQATKAIAPAQAVTGASSNVLAGGLAVGAEIFGFDLSQVGVATEMLDKMTVAGREGKAELEDLSSIFSRVGNNAKTANLDFSQTLGFIEQLSYVERQPERLATLADSTLRIFTNQKYQNNVRDKLGINFYGKEGNRRDAFSVIEEISTLYKKQKNDKQRDNLIAAAFGQTDMDTQRGMKMLLGGDAIAGMRKITEATRNGVGVIDRELEEALGNAGDQVSRLKGALGKAADSFAQPINNSVNQLIKYTLDSKKKGGLGLDGTDLLLGGAAVLAGGAAAYKYGGGKGLRKMMGKGGNLAGGVLTAKALEAAAGVIPVYVVNMPTGSSRSIVDDIMDMGRKGGSKGGRFPRLPGSGGYARLPGETLADSLSKLSVRSGFNAYASHWGGKALGWMGLNSSVLGGSVSSAGLGMGSLGVGVAGAAGYGAGTLGYNAFVKGTETEMDIGRALAKALATVDIFGWSDAQKALDIENRSQALLKVELSEDLKAKVVQSENMDVDAYGGSMINP